jgi:DNA-binding NarL/FixJ family response regulator
MHNGVGTTSPQLVLLIVDEVRVHRDALRAVLAQRPEVGEVRAAWDWSTTAGALQAPAPDVVLVDVRVTGCRELLLAIRTNAPSTRIVVLGVPESDDEVVACAEAGVHGYVLRCDPLDHLVCVMRTAVAGETLCTPRISAMLLRRVEALAAEARPTPKVPALTPREDQVLGLLDLGLSNQDIAQRLGIEVRTVKNHVHNVLEKVGAHRRGEAVAKFRRLRGESRGPGRPG